MNKVFGAIGHFFKHVGVLVADAFEKVFGSDAAHAFAVAAEGLIHTAIGEIAMTAVTEAEALAAGVDKRAAAFSKIASQAESAGISVTESIINLLIEICVQKVKGSFGPAPTA